MARPLLPIALLPALLAVGCSDPRPDDVPVVASVIGDHAELANPNRGPLTTPDAVLLDATAQGLVRFDSGGQIVPALAERWIVIDSGRSYIFRLRDAEWPDGSPLEAQQVVAALRRAATQRSRNPLAPFLQVIDEVVAMTPEVVEVRLHRPRPDLLKLFAQPELAIIRPGTPGGTGPFRVQFSGPRGVLLRPAFDPTRMVEEEIEDPDPADYVRLRGERVGLALARFAAGESDLVLGGTFTDWPVAKQVPLAPANVHFDPAIGLFGLAVVERDGFLAEPGNRAAIAMALDRAAITAAIREEWTPSVTLLPERLDSAAEPARPGWADMDLGARRAAARARVALWRRENDDAPVRLRIALPSGPGATLLWAHVDTALRAVGIEAERVAGDADADLRLVDRVAPYDSGRWFLVQACRLCSQDAQLAVEAARDAPTLEERARRIAQADAIVTGEAAFIPIAQPLRWSLVALRLTEWQGNSRAWHPLDQLRNSSE